MILPLLRLLMGLYVGHFLDSCCLAVSGGCMDANVCVVCWVRVSKSINLVLFMWLSETPLSMSMQFNSACTRFRLFFSVNLESTCIKPVSVLKRRIRHGLSGIRRSHRNSDFVFHIVNVIACFESASWLWSSTCRIIQCLQCHLTLVIYLQGHSMLTVTADFGHLLAGSFSAYSDSCRPGPCHSQQGDLQYHKL